MLSALSKYAERFFSKLLVHESWLKYHSDEAVIIESDETMPRM